MKSIAKDNGLSEAVKVLEDKQKFLINFNTKKVKELNKLKKECDDKKEELKELTDTIGKITSDSIMEINKKHKQILEKIDKHDVYCQSELEEIKLKDIKLKEEKKQIELREININNKEKEYDKANQKLKDYRFELFKRQEELEALEDYLINVKKDTEQIYRRAISNKQEIDKMTSLSMKENKIKKDKLIQEKEIVEKQTMTNSMERARIEIEWIKIKDQWKQLLNAKKHLDAKTCK